MPLNNGEIDMGCDIHIRAQKKINADWQTLAFVPFSWRNYSVFSWLAGVRNYSAISPISEPRGVPDDMNDSKDSSEMPWSYDHHGGELGDHSFSWLSVAELQAVNYEQTIENRRCARVMAAGYTSHGETCDPGQGEKMTLREFLGQAYFDDLNTLQEIGADRIVFGFDS